MLKTYVITADRRRFRIHETQERLGRDQPSLKLVDEVEFTETRGGYTGRDTDMAGRFGDNKGKEQGQFTQGSIDERLPMQNEMDRRAVGLIAGRINELLREHPQAGWSFATAPDLHHAVLEEIDPGARARLRKSLPKELTNVPVAELAEHFF